MQSKNRTAWRFCFWDRVWGFYLRILRSTVKKQDAFVLSELVGLMATRRGTKSPFGAKAVFSRFSAAIIVGECVSRSRGRFFLFLNILIGHFLELDCRPSDLLIVLVCWSLLSRDSNSGSWDWRHSLLVVWGFGVFARFLQSWSQCDLLFMRLGLIPCSAWSKKSVTARRVHIRCLITGCRPLAGFFAAVNS